MAQRKTNTSTSSKPKNNSNSTKSQSNTKSKTTNNKKDLEQKNADNQFWSIILFAIGVLSAFMTVIEGTSGWRIIHNFLLGMFGISVIAVPIILIYTALLIGKEKSQKSVTYRAFWGIALAILIGSIIQLFFVGEFEGKGFINIIKELYSSGKEFKGGGVSSIIFAGPLLLLFGVIGARIIVIIIACVFIMMLANISLFQLFSYIATPFKLIVKGLLFLRDFIFGFKWSDMSFSDDDDDDDDDSDFFDDEVIVKATKEDSDVIKLLNNKNKSTNETNDNNDNDESTGKSEIFVDDFILDVPIENELDKNDSKTKAEELSPVIDNALEALISKAAETKKIEDMIIDVDFDDEVVQKEKIEVVYKKPPIDLLAKVDVEENSAEAVAEMHEKAEIIVNTLKSFGVAVRISDIHRGPSITRYEIQPGAGVQVANITRHENDISLYLAAQGVRIEAPVPGKACVGIEVPNAKKDIVGLRELLVSKEFKASESKLTFAVGKDIAGNIILGDIAKMPHVIIAGTTGSGKSVCTRSIIMSLLYNTEPKEVRIILIDPKIVEFKAFEGIPQLLIPVITDAKKAAGALNWAVIEMMKRYQMFADYGANDLLSFNAIARENPELETIPQIVIFIDELADLMLVAKKEVEDYICRLAQMGRAAGVHLVVATQRPTTNVITGLIKANIPSRIALSVKSYVDSRTIIDTNGAEKLLGNGDMLYAPIGQTNPIRVQGCFSSTKDIEKTVEFVKTQMTGEYDDSVLRSIEEYDSESGSGKKNDSFSNTSASSSNNESDQDIIEKAIIIAVENGQLSTSMLQRKLKLGFARAARIMDELEELHVIGPNEGAKPRKVLISKSQLDERRARNLNNK